MKDFFNRNLAHIIAIVAFAAITYAFFIPLLQGKQLKQEDVIQWRGSAQEIIEYRNATGEEPLWTNSMFGGMPAFQISVLYPSNIFTYINDFIYTVFPSPAPSIFLSMVIFYFLLASFGISPILSAAGAIAFAFSTYNIIILQVGHNSKSMAMAYAPLIILGILQAFRGRYLLGAALAALGVGINLHANHLQITYYFLLVILIFGIAETVRVIQEKDFAQYFKAIGFLLIAAVIGILPNITQLLVTAEYGEETTRGQSELTLSQEAQTTGLDIEYATRWSYGVGETWTLLVPHFKGGGSGVIGVNRDAVQQADPQMRQVIAGMDKYFGDQPGTSGPVYVGAIICFLFILGLFFVEGPVKWWLLTATILSILLSWGRNFMPFTEFFMHYVPGYNKFRAVSMTLVIAQFTMPLLGLLAIKKIVETPKLLKEKQNYFWIAFGLTGGISLLMYLMPDMFNTFLKTGEYEDIIGQVKQAGWAEGQISLLFNSLEEARRYIFRMDAIRSFIFIGLAAALVFLFSKNIVKTNILAIGLLALIFIDMWTVGKRYLNETHFATQSIKQQPLQPSAADQQILQDQDPNYRVLNVSVSTFNDATTSFFHKSIGGYHGAKLKRYQELIEHQLGRNNMDVINMLNARYFIVPGQDRQPMAQRNPGALGNAWFVDEVKMVANADSEIVALTEFNPSSVAIVDQRFSNILNGFSPQRDNTGQISLESYQPNHLVYDYNASSDQLAVFSEIFYDKGWNAYIDGTPAEHFRANYVLRAMRLPAGSHQVEFKFEPSTYFTGERIALAGSILLVLFLGGAIYFHTRRRTKVEAV
jgi:hypothetical protein